MIGGSRFFSFTQVHTSGSKLFVQSQQVFANLTKSTPELFVQSQFDLSALCILDCKDICRCSVIIQYNFYKSIWSILTIVQVLFLQQSPTPCKIKALSLTLLFSTLQKKSRISPNEKYHPQGQFDQYSKRWLTWFSRELVRSRLPPLSTLSARLPASPSSLSWDFTMNFRSRM